MRRLLLAAFLASCVHGLDRPPAYGLDTSFTDAERWEIWQAAQDWNEHVREDHRIEVGAREWGWFIARGDLAKPTPGGWASRDSRIITLDEDLPVDLVRQVARHEMGHALGMNHVHRGWMQKATVSGQGFSDEDQTECRRVGACD